MFLLARLTSYLDRKDVNYTGDLWAVPLETGRSLCNSEDDFECRGIFLRACSVQGVDEGPQAGVCGLKTFRRAGYFSVDGKDHLRKLGWDGEWSLEAAEEFAVV